MTHQERIEHYIAYYNEVSIQVACAVREGDDRKAATHVETLAETHPVAALVLARNWATHAQAGIRREKAMDARDKCLENLMIVSLPVAVAALDWFRRDPSATAKARHRRLMTRLESILEAQIADEVDSPQTNEPWSPELSARAHATHLASHEESPGYRKALRSWRDSIGIFPVSAEPGAMTQRDFVLLSLLACEAVGAGGRPTHRAILTELFDLDDGPHAKSIPKDAIGKGRAGKRKPLRRLH